MTSALKTTIISTALMLGMAVPAAISANAQQLQATTPDVYVVMLLLALPPSLTATQNRQWDV